MKILTFVSSISLRTGGPSRSVPMLVRGLSELGLDITLMTLSDEDMNTEALEGCHARLKVFKRDSRRKDIEKYIVDEDFDLIHLQSIWEIVYHQIVLIAERHGIPYVISPRGMLEPWCLAQKKWKKKLALFLYQKRDLDRAACVLATANMEATNIDGLGVMAPIAVIPNGIDTTDFQVRSNPKEVKSQVLFLSRIHEKKGVELLIQTWQKISQDFPQWKLLIVGNGDPAYIDKLRQTINANSLSISLSEPVYGKAKVSLYRESSLFCLPSFSENFGMVVAEAMSCGVPVITTKNCPWEILNSTNTGWCIDLSADSLEVTLRESMMMEPGTLFKMGQDASSLVRSQFDYRSIAARTYTLYRWIIEGVGKPNFIQ